MLFVFDKCITRNASDARRILCCGSDLLIYYECGPPPLCRRLRRWSVADAVIASTQWHAQQRASTARVRIPTVYVMHYQDKHLALPYTPYAYRKNRNYAVPASGVVRGMAYNGTVLRKISVSCDDMPWLDKFVCGEM